MVEIINERVNMEKQIMKTIWNKFETWFNKNLGWFFTNGNKQ